MGNENSTAVGGIAIKNVLNNEITKITLDGVFVAIGRQPATEFLKNTGIKINENGYIFTHPDSSRTNIPFVYAVGDVADKPFKQGVIAAGYGAVASMEIQEDLEK